MNTSTTRNASFPPHRQKGAILIVAMLLSVVIAISLGSYISLSTTSLRLANRSFYNTSAINLAETGVEEALWCFNKVAEGTATATAWAGWDPSGTTGRRRTFSDFTLSNGATVSVRVLVDNYNPTGATQPKVYSEATVTMPTESLTLTKSLEVTLRRRSRFAMGLVAKNQINFNGNSASVDSWNSLYNDDGTPRASATAYSTGVRHAGGSVGSTSVAVGSVAVDNADIWGYASVGTSSGSGLSVGANGIISGDFSSPPGYIDTTRVATDFTANFDDLSNPTTGTYIGSVGATIGSTGVTATYSVNGAITGSFLVRGNVTLIISPSASGESIKMNGGSDTLTLDTGATLTIYTTGDIDLTGGGVINPNSQASSLQIYGTGGSSQDIEIGGGAQFTGVIYAPNANVKIHGTPEVMGSIVANNITVVGNAHFHYDEALANWNGSTPFGVIKWRELTTNAERTTAFASW